MIDCAPLIVADAHGLFGKYGVRVELKRQTGWATVREKILHNELDAAHAHASMAYAIQCGIGMVARNCLTGIVLSLNGSAITLSNELWHLGVRDAFTLKKLIERERGKRKFVFASVLHLSSQSFVIRRWLRSAGIDPDRDVQMVVLPSMLVHDNLKQGHIDGYCVGEPWSSVLLTEGHAWCVAASGEVCPAHPEKILLVLREFAEQRAMEHLAMIAAILEASLFCQAPENREELVRILAQPTYLDMDPGFLSNCLIGPFNAGKRHRVIDDLVIYSGRGANVPSRDKAKWVYEEIDAHCAPRNTPAFRRDVMRKVFREDIYWDAVDLVETVSPGLIPVEARRSRTSPTQTNRIPTKPAEPVPC
jgi:ABC-type nitrate/sulfonate/bicarbonate transport system substrate-binding protein